MKHGIVSRIDDGAFRYQAWPTVARAKDGTLFVGCSGHRIGHFCPFGKNYLYESHDEGETWIGPRIINDSYLDDRDVGLLAWGEQNLLMCSCNHSPEQYLQRDEKVATRTHYKLRTPLATGMRTYWDHGYPTSVELDNGDIFTVYYAKCPGDEFNSLHYLRWKLDELVK